MWEWEGRGHWTSLDKTELLFVFEVLTEGESISLFGHGAH